jgi:uncharacterized protein YbjT (DUF2867 family)
MKILLTGAGGFIGRHLLNVLQHQGHEVVAMSKRTGGDFNTRLNSEDWLPELAGVEAVINCVGIISESATRSFQTIHIDAPIALFRACVTSGVRRVIQISALGADAQATSAFHLSKLAADDALRKLPLDWFILRPSLVVGTGCKSLIWFRRMAAWPVLALPGKGEQLLQPVHIRDLLSVVQKCLDPCVTPGVTIDVVGPEVFTFRRWMLLLRDKRLRQPLFILPMPMPLLLAISPLAALFLPLLSPENLHMLQRGNTADSTTLVHFLGREPISIESEES